MNQSNPVSKIQDRDVIIYVSIFLIPFNMTLRLFFLILLFIFLPNSANAILNNPYTEDDGQLSVLYESFSERPKHLDPAVAYTSNEYAILGQIYESPFQYHYLKRPYQLIPLTATKMPEIRYLNQNGELLTGNIKDSDIKFTDYIIEIKPNIQYQPHPALAKNEKGDYIYHHLTPEQLDHYQNIADFKQTGSRELIADDYIYQIKRLAYSKLQSPIAETMKNYIVGFDEFSEKTAKLPKSALKTEKLSGVELLNRYSYRVRIKGKYPQFQFWLAMPFFAPMPWEADSFYDQQGLNDKNITLDWYPIGTGAYYLSENNPNRRMILLKNPLFHYETYPTEGEPDDEKNGLLVDAGKPLPFIDKVVFILEKETIPYWSKFLQGYYDLSGISSDSFDQAIQFTGSGGARLTETMLEKDIKLETAVTTSNYYLGVNILDNVIGGHSESAKKLRQAISIAVDFEEYIAIFMNGRGVAAQGVIPPGIYGYAEGQEGINSIVYDWIDNKPVRKPISVAKKLMEEAGFKDGIDPKTKEPLILYFDTTAVNVDDKPRMNWYRKQFDKLGIKLVVRATDFNRFQEKLRLGNAQLYFLGWNADYPDPENFLFLLYGEYSKAKTGGENSSNYKNTEFDSLFEQMRNMDNGHERYQLIQKLQNILREDAPWLFGFHPKSFALHHSWFKNLKPNLMANNQLKYTRIDAKLRAEKRKEWNQPIWSPLLFGLLVLMLLFIPAIKAYRRRIS